MFNKSRKGVVLQPMHATKRAAGAHQSDTRLLDEPTIMLTQYRKLASLALHRRMPHVRGAYGYNQIEPIVLLKDAERPRVFSNRGGHAGIAALLFGLERWVQLKLEPR